MKVYNGRNRRVNTRKFSPVRPAVPSPPPKDEDPPPQQPPPSQPSSPTGGDKKKGMFSQDDGAIVALGVLNMKNQKIANVKHGNDAGDAVNNTAMQLYCTTNFYKKVDGDTIAKIVDTTRLAVESLPTKVQVTTTVANESAAMKKYVDNQIAAEKTANKDVHTSTETYLTSLNGAVRSVKEISQLRQAAINSSFNGNFETGIFVKDIKITSILVNNFTKGWKLHLVHNKVFNNTGTPKIEKVLLLPKLNSLIEFECNLEVTDTKYVTLELTTPANTPATSPISVTIMYEQRSTTVPSQ
jgi:hypothetical protein